MIESRLHVDVPYQREFRNELRPKRIQSQEKQRSILSLCREIFNQYLTHSSLHGLKYVGDRMITRLERLFFACSFVLVIIFSTYFISNIWNKWRQSPLIITQSAESIPVGDLPFPAVTICNHALAQKSAVHLLNENEEDIILQNICRRPINESLDDSMAQIWEPHRRILLKVSQPCEKMIVSCQFGHVNVNCSKIFNRILTDGGLCCIFNGLHKKFIMRLDLQEQLNEKWDQNDYMENMANNWTPETGFHSDELKKHVEGYPKPGLGSGKHLGLKLVLNAETNEYYCSSTYGYGFKVLVHSPHELPEIDEYGLSIASGFESRIVTTPIIARASEAVRYIPKKIRQCVFENENDLTLYRIYSRRNCLNECVLKLSYTMCNCTVFYMPRLVPNITICGHSDLVCVNRIRDELHAGTSDTFKCNCPYGCHDIKFDMELSSTPIFEELIEKKNLVPENASILQVYYQRGFYRSQDKEELIGFTEFLSNMGGLLGLFMGFSIFSLIEILYFVTIRPYCNFKRKIQRRRTSVRPAFKRFNDIKLGNLNSNIFGTTTVKKDSFPH